MTRIRTSEQTDRLWGIGENETISVYKESDGTEIRVTQGKKYWRYDIKIEVVGDIYGANYAPTHLQLLRDLERRIDSRPEEAERLFEIIEAVFEGTNPDEFVEELAVLPSDGVTFSTPMTIHLLQQMMVEQEINFGPCGQKGHFTPPRDLLMSCIRWVFHGDYRDTQDIVNAAKSGEIDKRFQCDDETIWTRPKW